MRKSGAGKMFCKKKWRECQLFNTFDIFRKAFRAFQIGANAFECFAAMIAHI